MTASRTSDLWWKNAIVYCLDVETFLDRDGDGIGDLRGLTDRVDYLAGIGVTCIWLMPFFPSPNRDDGYDITDHYAVDPRVGSLGDLVAFVRTAKDRGMRIIVDLVVNHTSDQHPWFRSARRSKDSPHHDWYVWVEEEPRKPHAEVVFPDAEDSIWTRDDKTGEWYLHHFYSHQPDLNIGNPAVRDEIAKIAGFWLQLGVDGFRVDAVPFLIDTEATGAEGELRLDPHELLRDLRDFTSRRRGDSVLLGEVNLPPEQLVEFFGADDEFELLFDFPLMQAMYLALARSDAGPLRGALEARPDIPEDAQWAIFVRNHDELTLDQLTDAERREVFDAFGPDEEMQLYGRGLRRRLPPMLDGDQDRIRLVYSLLFSLPGTPVLFYGEEIGMGENLDVDGRLSVRTPMQWDAGRNAGFSTARPSRLTRPVPDGQFGPLAVNVADQRRRPDSLLTWMEQVIRRRRETPELGWGSPTVLDTGDDAVLAHRCDWEGTAVVAIHNLSATPRELRLDLGPMHGCDQVADLLDSARPVHDVDRSTIDLTLGRYAHHWFRLQASDRSSPP
ncbi:MAG TPA: alpha-amylase family protein [Acidimicrobiales bacterium]|nr:alpha-amylase family protein [Acidimicrobiales bacterium]